MTDWVNRARTMSIHEFTPPAGGPLLESTTTDDGRGSHRARVHQWTNAGKTLKKSH